MEGWQGGSEWINTGAYVERINFATRVLNDPSKVGVRDIIDRIKTGNVDGMMTSDELVDNCLKVMGPISLLQSTSTRLKEYASKYDDFDLTIGQSDSFDKAALAVIQLIVSTQEYQTA